MASIPPTTPNAIDVLKCHKIDFNFDVNGFEKMAATAQRVAQFKFTVDFHDPGTKTSSIQGLQGRVVYIAAESLEVALKALQVYAKEVEKSGSKVLDDKTCRHVFFSKLDKSGACTASLCKGQGRVEEVKVTIDKTLAKQVKYLDAAYKKWEKGNPPINPSSTPSLAPGAIAANVKVTP